jgi:hypothetical protein
VLSRLARQLNRHEEPLKVRRETTGLPIAELSFNDQMLLGQPSQRDLVTADRTIRGSVTPAAHYGESSYSLTPNMDGGVGTWGNRMFVRQLCPVDQCLAIPCDSDRSLDIIRGR